MVSANQSELPAGVKYVVMDENTLGYVIEGNRNIIGVLTGSVIRGGRNWLNGPAVVSPGFTRLRPATEADFDFIERTFPTTSRNVAHVQPTGMTRDNGCSMNMYGRRTLR